jgi:RNA polymerase sigma-70 factor (ECF subfamily)
MPSTITEAQIVAIYRETVDALYGYASRKCGGERQLAEDVTQEAWLRAVREWRRSGLPDRPLAWLTTVTRNLLFNHFRRHEPVPLDAVPAEAVIAALEADDAIDSSEVAALVHVALARLPAHEARLIEEFHFGQCRVARLAEQYGTSERAIEGRLRRARERLRRELETDGSSTLPRAEGGIT